MEHGVYLCNWYHSPDGFAIWVKSRPRIRGEALTYPEAEERLIEAIQNAGGAMQAVLEFEPPLPKTSLEAKYTDPELYLIGGDVCFETNAPKGVAFETTEEREDRFKWLDSFFESPICRKCAFATSPRSARPLFLEYSPRRCDGAFGYAGSMGTNTIQLLSEEFLNVLTASERRGLQLRAVTGKRRANRFYELTGPSGPPFVAVAGLKIKGWRCSACGHRTWGHWIEGMAINCFIARTNVSPSLTGVFTIGGPPDVHLAATAARWQDLVGRNGARGFAGSRLGVVPDHEVVRHPDLPTNAEKP